MQSRAVREGSVGLMLLAGLGVFGAIFLWLKGLAPGSQTYNIIAKFDQAPGIQPGGVVRFRGIRVGKIAKIAPGANGVEVVLQMDDPSLIIPKDVVVEISQTGLIGEPVMEITPNTTKALDTSALAKAVDSNCDPKIILCNNARVDGQIGSNFNELLRRATKLVDLYNNPEVVRNLNNALIKAGTAADDVSRLSRSVNKLSTDFSKLPKTVESGLGNISVKADVLTASLGQTSSKFGKTADQLNLTAAEYKKLAISVNGLVSEHRKTFNSSLKNFDLLSSDLRKTVNAINPSIVKLNTTISKVNTDKLAKDLEAVLSNANQTSLNLKNISANINNPQTLTILQQTLDSARSTFQNTQKITADLDDLTGNPEFRSNVKNLVNGLGKLVSSAEQLEQQAKLAQTIEPLGQSLSYHSQLPLQNPPPINPGRVSLGPNLNPNTNNIDRSILNKIPTPNSPIQTPNQNSIAPNLNPTVTKIARSTLEKLPPLNPQFSSPNKVSNGLPSVLSRFLPEGTSGARAAATAIGPNLNLTVENIDRSTLDPQDRLKAIDPAMELFPNFPIAPFDRGSTFNSNPTPNK
jgi:phospholipid/cholesterol/gamma-HCH transport system substrate-binding protein